TVGPAGVAGRRLRSGRVRVNHRGRAEPGGGRPAAATTHPAAGGSAGPGRAPPPGDSLVTELDTAATGGEPCTTPCTSRPGTPRLAQAADQVTLTEGACGKNARSAPRAAPGLVAADRGGWPPLAAGDPVPSLPLSPAGMPVVAHIGGVVTLRPSPMTSP